MLILIVLHQIIFSIWIIGYDCGWNKLWDKFKETQNKGWIHSVWATYIAITFIIRLLTSLQEMIKHSLVEEINAWRE